MRYFHEGAKQICDYVQSRKLIVAKLDNVAPSSSTIVDIEALGEALKKSETLWGGSLPYYLRFSNGGEKDAVLSLKDAVAKIEAAASEDEFIVVAHPDGGLISVSGVMLPFQKGADVTSWSGLGARWSEKGHL